ncbi:AMP-binding protein [Povalibacter sp.]|uniref:AMP-binding protein n=1 Tax=Povalibacter sp. TaxID=1962978 RepID=UPI002F3EDAC1
MIEHALTQAAQVPFRRTYFPSARMDVERRSDGTLIVRAATELQAFVPNIPAELASWARRIPEQTYLAQRPTAAAPWIRHTYAATKRDVDAVAQWLLDLEIVPERSVLVLSGNSIAHAIVKYGAMSARIALCPVSVNYALMGGDYGRLKHVIRLVRPAVVFAEQAALYRAALENVDFGDAVIVTDDPKLLRRPAVALSEVLATRVTDAVTTSIEAIDPDAPAAYMMTSGSTSLPKAVIQTQRMIAANLAQGRQVFGQTAGWHETMLDWLPWNHVSGAFTKMGVLTSGGTLYIDGGRPMPGKFEESIANLKELAPSFYVNVPIGYAMLADALESDAELRERFFGGVRLALYGGAGLPQALYDRFQELAVRTIGERIFFTTGYGATETTSGCMSIYFPTEQVGIGLPMPGVEVKLVPIASRYEVRMRGPMITPGYLGVAGREMFDEEGFYRSGDTAQFHDDNDVQEGLKFAGRLAEEFKLSNGTWVSAGALRARLLEACAPVLSDALICGEHRAYVAVLAWTSDAGCRSIAGADAQSPVEVQSAIATFLAQRLATFNAGRGSSAKIQRLRLLIEPPSIDAHEVSDKGTINQRVALERRSQDVEQLYADPPSAGTLYALESNAT